MNSEIDEGGKDGIFCLNTALQIQNSMDFEFLHLGRSVVCPELQGSVQRKCQLEFLLRKIKVCSYK